MCRAGGIALLVDVGRIDRDDLAFETPLVPCPLSALLRLETEPVGLVASNAPAVGDSLGAFELRRLLVEVAIALREWAAEVGTCRRAERHAAHRLDAT